MFVTERVVVLREYSLPNGKTVYQVVGGIQPTKSKVVLVLDTSGSMGSMPKEFLSDPPVSMALLTAGPVRQASSLKIVKKEDEARSHD